MFCWSSWFNQAGQQMISTVRQRDDRVFGEERHTEQGLSARERMKDEDVSMFGHIALGTMHYGYPLCG